MVSASVRNAAVDFPIVSSPQMRQEKVRDVSFDDYFNVALEEVQEESPYEQKPAHQVKETQSAEDASASETTEATTTGEKTQVQEADDNQENQETNMEKEKFCDETQNLVREGVQEIAGKLQELLQLSQEELEEMLEQNGIDLSALLNPENMQQILAEILGVESPIEFVTDENMYVDLQALVQAIREQIEVLTEETQLTPQELEQMMLALKMQPKEMTEAGTPAVVELESVSDDMMTAMKENVTQEVVAEPEETTEATSAPEVVVEGERETTEEQSAQDMQQGNATANPQQLEQQTTQQIASEQVQERMNPFDTENLMKQLADFIKVKQGENLTEMEMQLHPASLGTVHIQLTSKAGVVTAQISAQNEIVKEAIEAQVVELKTNLESQGVKIEAIEISVASHQMERNLEEDGRQQQKSEEEQAQRVAGTRRKSINLRSIEEGIDMLEGNEIEDDAVRIAMEIMSMNGNSMDLLA